MAEETKKEKTPEELEEERYAEWCEDHTKLTLQDILQALKGRVEGRENRDYVRLASDRIQQYCEQLASYVEYVPRGLSRTNCQYLGMVFYELAESIRDLPENPQTALQRVTNVRYDVSRIPDLGDEVRRAGYEAGYRAAQENRQRFVGDVDIDID